MQDNSLVPPGVDENQTTAARLYSLLLNPTEGHFLPVDLLVCDQLRSACPEITDIAHNNRIFVRRATRFLVNQGIKQLIDLGSGLPADENTHEVAHAIDPNVRVVYDDKDPITVAHAHHLLQDAANVAFLGEDIADVDALLQHPETQKLIDFDQPVGIVIGSVMQLFPQEVDTHAMMRRYIDALPPGSYLALSQFVTPGTHPPLDGPPADRVAALLGVMEAAGEPLQFRPREEIERYFEGLELVQPYAGSEEHDLVWCNRWGAKDPARAHQSGSWLLAGVGKKV